MHSTFCIDKSNQNRKITFSVNKHLIKTKISTNLQNFVLPTLKLNPKAGPCMSNEGNI